MSEELISLEESLRTAGKHERFDLLIQLSLHNFKISPIKAISYAQEALAISESEHDPGKRGSALNALGKAHLGKMNHTKSLVYLHKALAIYEKLASKSGSAEVMGNIGIFYLSTGNPDNALEYFEKCMKLYTEMNDRKHLAKTLNSMGLALSNLDRDDEALIHLDDAYRIATEENEKKVIRSAKNNMGILLYKQGKLEDAVDCFKKALVLSENSGELRSLAGNLINIGTCSIELGRFEDAHEYLARGLSTAKKCEAIDFMMQACYSLSGLFSREEDFKSALEYHKQMSDIQQQLYTNEKSKAVAEIEARYETEKTSNKAEINRLKNIELAEKNKLIETQSISLQHANAEINKHKEELLAKNNELEKLLKEKDEFLSRMVAHISDGVIMDDPEGNILYANDRFLKIFGLSRDDLGDVEPFSLIAPEWRDQVRTYHKKRLAREHLLDRQEYEGIRKDGQRIWLEVGSTLVESDGEIHGTQSMVRDVTERKMLEAQLLQSQRIDAVGRLAGGISHDFNNLLMVIRAHSEFILGDLSNEHPLRADAEEIRNATDRASSLIRQLLAFSKQQIQQPKTLDLREVVSGLHRMLSRLLSEDIRMDTIFSDRIGCVLADESQIEQVIVNLVINARDAMESGGKLTIKVDYLDISKESHPDNLEISPGKYVVLSVTDSGKGMDAETKARVFEPFFSTKASDKGSGLGLAMVYGIIKQSGGEIQVTSTLGEGSTFSIYLPRVDGEHIQCEYQPPPSTKTGKGEKILLVEDDDALRRLSRKFLLHEGYKIISAGSAEEALETAEKAEEEFDLLLTDIVLPGINGFLLAEKLIENGFKGHILYMTGYADDSNHKMDVKKGDKNLLEKPFSLYIMSHRIREILDPELNWDQPHRN